MRRLRDYFLFLLIATVLLAGALLVVLARSGASLRESWVWLVALAGAAIGDGILITIYEGQPKRQSPGKFLLWGIGNILMVIGALSFWAGGGLIHDYFHTNRIVAEMEGIGLSVLCFALGFFMKSHGQPDKEDDADARSRSAER